MDKIQWLVFFYGCINMDNKLDKHTLNHIWSFEHVHKKAKRNMNIHYNGGFPKKTYTRMNTFYANVR